MLSKTEALQFAHGWVRAWNSHDLDAVMSHYRQIVPNATECSACVESWDIDSLWGIAAKLAEALTLRVLGL